MSWLAVDKIFHQIVLLFLDSYEVLFTKDKLSKYLTYVYTISALQAGINEHAYALKHLIGAQPWNNWVWVTADQEFS